MVAAWSAPLGAPQIGAPQHDSEEEKYVEAAIANVMEKENKKQELIKYTVCTVLLCLSQYTILAIRAPRRVSFYTQRIQQPVD